MLQVAVATLPLVRAFILKSGIEIALALFGNRLLVSQYPVRWGRRNIFLDSDHVGEFSENFEKNVQPAPARATHDLAQRPKIFPKNFPTIGMVIEDIICGTKTSRIVLFCF